MNQSGLSWLDQPVPVVRKLSGAGSATPLEITGQHDHDPIIAVRFGHPLADRGFEFLMRDILQAAMAPRDSDAWMRLLTAPPTPGQLAVWLAPYRAAFHLDHPTTPAMQVRPSAAQLAKMTGRKPSKAKRPPAGDDDDEEDAGALPIAALLPDLPTGEAVKQDTDFFVRRDGVKAIGAGAVLPVLYAHMVLFPPGGGGYLGLPHGADSIKYQMVGRTLWETLWLNVLHIGMDGLEDPNACWPAPVDGTVFPWLDLGLSEMPLGRKDEGAAKPIERTGVHPAHIPMPRRYLLSAPIQGRCDLTGTEGPVFTSYSRWPKGLQYEPRGWWYSAVSRVESAAAKPDEDPRFVRARGPLRFDDWLETALLEDEKPRDGRNSGKQRRLPPALRQFGAARVPHRSAFRKLAGSDGSGSSVSRHGAFRVRAFAQFLFNKPVGGMSQRELPVWFLPASELDWLRNEVSAALQKVGEAGAALQSSARSAVRMGRREGLGTIADHLQDGLMASLDGTILDLPARLAEVASSRQDEADQYEAADAMRDEIFRQAERAALALFDGAFPIGGADTADKLLAQERGRLVRRLRAILKSDLKLQPSKVTP
jgi:CRISPR system Cascade subunit CasA